MDYDRIILELLDRISILEEKVDKLSKTDKKADSAIPSVGKKYRFLADNLYSSGENSVRLTFSDIEKILNDRLPESAYRHKAFWANTDSHSIALSWLSVGYQTVEVSMEDKYVVFEKRRNY